MANDAYWTNKRLYEEAEERRKKYDDSYWDAKNSGDTDARNTFDRLRDEARDERDKYQQRMWDAEKE